jgi:Rrf2 family transcriptional regulator, iron-sulfur cluster assembly transcription factor
MFSNSCKYGIRAVIYLASRHPEKSNIGIKEISGDLKLPTPFLAKILQQLAKNRILSSTKGPNGGFSLLKKPEAITIFDLVKIIDGEGFFNNCLIHDGTCAKIKRSKKVCPVHKDYAVKREELTNIFKSKTIADLSKNADNSENILI